LDELGVFQQIEELVERYLRHDVLEEAERAIGSSVAAYNAWVTAANEASEAASRELEQERASIEEMGAAISRLDAGLEVRPGLSASPREVEAFNARMAERNALAARHRQAVEAHNTAVQEFNRE